MQLVLTKNDGYNINLSLNCTRTHTSHFYLFVQFPDQQKKPRNGSLERNRSTAKKKTRPNPKHSFRSSGLRHTRKIRF